MCNAFLCMAVSKMYFKRTCSVFVLFRSYVKLSFVEFIFFEEYFFSVKYFLLIIKFLHLDRNFVIIIMLWMCFVKTSGLLKTVLWIVWHNFRLSKPTTNWKGSWIRAVIIRGAFTIHTFLPWTNNNAGCNNWWCRKFRTDLKGVSMETLSLSVCLSWKSFYVQPSLVYKWKKKIVFLSYRCPPVFILFQSVFYSSFILNQ